MLGVGKGKGVGLKEQELIASDEGRMVICPVSINNEQNIDNTKLTTSHNT